MDMTTVFNLATGDEAIYSLPPFEAVVAAHEQLTRGNYNTWDYRKPMEHGLLKIGKLSVSCGDWAALKG
jgi:hypothetical protein